MDPQRSEKNKDTVANFSKKEKLKIIINYLRLYTFYILALRCFSFHDIMHIIDCFYLLILYVYPFLEK